MTFAEYSLSCGLFLLLGDTQLEAQVVYTDIEPDIILFPPFNFSYLDVDADGENDFLFGNENFTTITAASLINKNIQQVVVYGNCSNSASIVVSKYYHTAPGFGFSSIYAAMFPPVNIVSGAMSFECIAARLAFISHFTEGGEIYDAGGNWFPSFNHKYLGARFTDTMNCKHYGWIRCTVKDSAHILIVEDYAFETVCDKPVIAGSMESYVDLNSENANISVEIYPNPTMDILHILIGSDVLKKIEIFDLRNNLIYQNEYATYVNTSSFPAGLFYARVSTESGYVCFRQFEKL